MTTYAQLAEFRQLLSAMPQQKLVDAMVEYAGPDPEFMRHFTALGHMATAGAPDKILNEVLANIDSTFGDADIPDSLEWEQQVPFMNVGELIQGMLKLKMYDEVIQAAERCFEYVENLAGVHWPDDFLECYEPITRAWILALHGLKVPVDSIAKQVGYLEDMDQHGAFFDLAKRFADELGATVIQFLKQK